MLRNWPLSGLRIRAGAIELRHLDDDLLDELADLAAAGIHGPDEMPFAAPWSTVPQPELGRNTLAFHWRARAEWSPSRWNLGLGVFSDGRLVGEQALHSERFAVSRTVGTGSWLGRAHQGRGIGTAMRRAVLSFAFDHLGALRAESGWLDGNAASERVSRALGYVDEGTIVRVVDDRRRLERRVSMSADAWAAAGHPPVRVEGLDACRDLFGT